MNEISIVTDFAGAQLGTPANPLVAKTSADFDKIMRSHSSLDQLAIHLNDGTFYTAGTHEWGDPNDYTQYPGFRIGRQWTFDSGTNATLAWDVDAVPDSAISDTPICLLLSTSACLTSGSLSPQAVWDLQPRGQAVRNLNIDLQFSKAVDRWKSKNAKLKIAGAMLAGHEASIEKVHITNIGALGVENFPLLIVGAIGSWDRDLIAQLDPNKYIFDANIPDVECSHITDCVADGYDELDSNNQVTVRMIAGNIGERTPGEWIQHMRAYAYQSGNNTIATGKNFVQAHTIYQVLRGSIANNKSQGAAIGVYGDFDSTTNLNISLNQFLTCDYGIRLLLSPTGPGFEQFSHENYTIGPNMITSSGPNVSLDTCGPSTPTRYIRNFSIDSALSLEAIGATNITRTGAIAKKGCNPFSFLHR